MLPCLHEQWEPAPVWETLFLFSFNNVCVVLYVPQNNIYHAGLKALTDFVDVMHPFSCRGLCNRDSLWAEERTGVEEVCGWVR